MNEWELDSKIRNSLLLLFGTIVYLVTVVFLLLKLSEIFIEYRFLGEFEISTLLFIALLPLFAVLIITWGYSYKLKMPGLELEYYPVEKVMKPPFIITEDKTINEADEIMDKEKTDFLNIIDNVIMGNEYGVASVKFVGSVGDILLGSNLIS